MRGRRVRWRRALVGGAITAGLFVLGRWAIGLYLAEAAPGSAYGSFGTLVLLLMCFSLLKGIRHEYALLRLQDKEAAGAA